MRIRKVNQVKIQTTLMSCEEKTVLREEIKRATTHKGHLNDIIFVIVNNLKTASIATMK
jgi:hypothetical protein